VGIDTGFKLEGMGRIDISALGTLLQKYESEPALGLGTYDCVGLHGATCGTPNPKWRHRATLTWNTPYDLSVSTSWRYVGGVKDEGSSDNPLITPNRNARAWASPNHELPSVSYFDLSVSYTFMKAFTLRAGVRNLFDKDPPLAVAGAPFGNGNTYPTVYDALGRQMSLNLTAKF
jgi:outer membrane receptor protein involved in Fe transport